MGRPAPTGEMKEPGGARAAWAMQRRRGRAEAAKGGAEAGNKEEATKDRSAENAAIWRKWGGTKMVRGMFCHGYSAGWQCVDK
jgi:hypothetical protein